MGDPVGVVLASRSVDFDPVADFMAVIDSISHFRCDHAELAGAGQGHTVLTGSSPGREISDNLEFSRLAWESCRHVTCVCSCYRILKNILHIIFRKAVKNPQGTLSI